MATTTARLTIDDFEKLPSELAKNRELVDGQLIDESGNTPKHNIIRDYVIELLRPFVRARKLGLVIAEQEYDFGGNAHGPDVSFFGPDKKALLDRKRRVQPFVPDLAIEIASHNDSVGALWQKKDRYLECGTKEVWIVVPDSQEVSVYSAASNRIVQRDGELTTPLLPEITLKVADLFATE